MVTREQIFQIIKSNNYPYWELLAIDGLNCISAGSAKLLNLRSDASDEDKTERSIKELEDTLKQLDGYSKFSITIKAAKTSNGSKVLGPFTFSVGENSPGQTQQPLSGIPQNMEQMGYVPATVMEQRLSLLQQQNEINLEKRLLEEEKKQFAERQKENNLSLRTMEEKFNSNTEQLSKAGIAILEKGMGMLFGSDESYNLAGTTQDIEAETIDGTTDENEQIVEEIATDIFENVKDPETLRKVKEVINNSIIKNIKEPGINVEIPENQTGGETNLDSSIGDDSEE